MPKRPDLVLLCILLPLLLALAGSAWSGGPHRASDMSASGTRRARAGARGPAQRKRHLARGAARSNQREPDGSWRFCYVLASGAQAPTLRLHPGDRLVLTLKNELNIEPAEPAQEQGRATTTDPAPAAPWN